MTNTKFNLIESVNHGNRMNHSRSNQTLYQSKVIDVPRIIKMRIKNVEHLDHLNEQVTKSTNIEAAILLLNLMQDLSEEHWHAGWMDGTEYTLWESTSVPDDQEFNWGASNILPEERKQLRDLSEKANGWWIWNESKSYAQCETFLKTDDWKKKYYEETAAVP